MPNNRVKTSKALQSKKGGVAGHKLHPNSRRAKQFQRVQLRTKKLEIQGKVVKQDFLTKLERHAEIIRGMPPSSPSVALEELHGILQEYIARNDEELLALKTERESRTWRKGGSAPSAREAELTAAKEREMSEYRSGYTLPDLTEAKNVILCRQWLSPRSDLVPQAHHDSLGQDEDEEEMDADEDEDSDEEEETIAQSGSTHKSKKQKPMSLAFFPRLKLIRIFEGDKTAVVVTNEGALKTGNEVWIEGQDKTETAMEE